MWTARLGSRRSNYVILAVAVVAAALALAALITAFSRWRSIPPPLTYVEVTVEGEGLVNGSKSFEVKGIAPYIVTLVAKPARYWRLAYWLVNGSKAGTSTVLTLTVRANTSVVAVFEEMVCVLRVEGREGMRFEHAGRVYEVPALLAAPCGSTLRLKPLYDLGEGEELTVVLDGNKTLTIPAALVEIDGSEVPRLWVNGTAYEGVFRGFVPLNTTLVVEGEDKPAENNCTWTVVAWNVYTPKANETVYSPRLYLRVVGDTKVEPVVKLVEKGHPPIVGEVVVGNETRKVIMITLSPG